MSWIIDTLEDFRADDGRFYGHWETLPVIMNGRAWAYNPIKKEWYRIHMADAYCKARLCTKAEFIDCWPDLPELPTVK